MAGVLIMYIFKLFPVYSHQHSTKKRDFSDDFMILHLRFVLLFLMNLIENYKIKYLPWGLNPEIHNRNDFLKNEKIFAVTGD